MIAVSKMAAAVQPSATLAAGARAKQLQAEGVKVFDFSLGEPDFPTPEHICAAAVKAMKDGHTHYTPANGIPALRTAVSRFYQKTYGMAYKPEQVLISNGAKHSIHNALAATVGPGDEVIIPTPYWVSYSDLVQMTGASSVLVPTTMESGFKMTPAQLRAAVTPRSKLLMLNSPSNPTGSVYTRQELEALADVVLETGLSVLSDEIYEKLVFGDAKATCFASLRPELAERVITISGASKTLRHDRLAHGLGAGSGARYQGDGGRAEPADGLPVQRQPVRGPGGPGGRSGVRRADAARVRGAARSGVRPAVGHAGRAQFGRRKARFMRSSTCRPTSAGRWAGARWSIPPVSAWRRWRRPTSTWWPAPRSAPRATCGCPTPPAATS